MKLESLVEPGEGPAQPRPFVLDLRPRRRNDCALRPRCPSCKTQLPGVVARDAQAAAAVELNCPSCRFVLTFEGPGLLIDRRASMAPLD